MRPVCQGFGRPQQRCSGRTGVEICSVVDASISSSGRMIWLGTVVALSISGHEAASPVQAARVGLGDVGRASSHPRGPQCRGRLARGNVSGPHCPPTRLAPLANLAAALQRHIDASPPVSIFRADEHFCFEPACGMVSHSWLGLGINEPLNGADGPRRPRVASVWCAVSKRPRRATMRVGDVRDDAAGRP